MPYGKAFINTAHVQLVGGPAANFYKYPRCQEAHNITGPMEHHLFYPSTAQEKPHAEPAPWPFHGLNPEAFIAAGYPFDPAIEKLFHCKQPYGSTDDCTHFVDSNSWSTGQLGSALSFSARLIANHMDRLPNFCLDGDRGYGWKTWRADDPERINHLNPLDVNYLDA